MTGYLDALARAAALADGDSGDTEASPSTVPAFSRSRRRFEPVWDERDSPAWPVLDEVVEQQIPYPDGLWPEEPARAPEFAPPEGDTRIDPDRAPPAHTPAASSDMTDRKAVPPVRTALAIPEVRAAEDADPTIPQPPVGTVNSVPDGPTGSRAPRPHTPLQPTEEVGPIRATESESPMRPSIEATDRPVAGQPDPAAPRAAAPADEDRYAGEPPLWARAETHPATASTLAAEVSAALHERPTDEPRQPVVIEIGRIEVRIAADPPPPPRRERPPRPRTGPTLAEYLDGLPGTGGRSA